MVRFRSRLAFSGRQSSTRRPKAAPIIAYAMPVLPDVESRITLSGVSCPVSKAVMIIHRPARSLTEPPGLNHSALA